MSRHVSVLWVLVATACSGSEPAATTPTDSAVVKLTPCGEALECDANSEFCLVTVQPGGAEAWTCEPLPSGCSDIEALCVADPSCAPRWYDVSCPDFASVTCTSDFATCYVY